VENEHLSRSNHRPVANSGRNSQHLESLGGAAVGVRIRGIEEEIVWEAAERTVFARGHISNDYGDGHWHVGLPRKRAAA
jgi:hypothetical protein